MKCLKALKKLIKKEKQLKIPLKDYTTKNVFASTFKYYCKIVEQYLINNKCEFDFLKYCYELIDDINLELAEVLTSLIKLFNKNY